MPRKKYLLIKYATVKIQLWWKARVLGRKTRISYLLFKKHIIFIQSLIRKLIAQKTYEKQRYSAILIQRNIRKMILRKKLCLLKSSAIVIQSWWRAKLLCRNEMHAYQITRYRIILLQSLIKSFIAQKAFQRKKLAAIIIQKYVRQYLKRKKYLSTKSSVELIQSYWRAKILGRQVRISYLIALKRIVFLQSLMRKFIAQKQYKKKKFAATIIQKNVRMYLTRKKYLSMKLGVELIQSRWRAKILGRQARASYLITIKRIVLLQSFIRRFIALTCYKRKRFAAIVIQKYARRLLALRKFRQLISSVVVIQTWFKAILLGKQTRALYLKYLNNVVLVQSLIRKFLIRKVFMKKRLSAIIIQKYIRKFITKKNFCILKTNTIKIQKWWRNLLISLNLRKKYLLYQSAAIKIQSSFRSYKSQKQFRKLKNAVRLVELYQFGKKQRLAFLETKYNIITIQAYYRRYRCRKLFLTQKNAAITIQSVFKMYKARKYFSILKLSTIKIQRHYSLYQQMCITRNNYLKIKLGFTRLQAFTRGNKVRKEIEILNKKAIIIQTFYRMYTAKYHFQKFKRSCIFIQRKYRAQKLKRIQSRNYKNLKNAAITLQKYIRCYIASKQYNKMKVAIIKIQAFVRMKLTRQTYCATRQAVIYIQQTYRLKCLMNKQRLDYVKKRNTVIFLQSKVKTYNVRKQFLRIKSACILIQSMLRMWIKRTAYQKLRNATIIIQKYFRAFLVGKRIRSNFLCIQNAVTKIQSFSRMIRLRKQYKETKDLIVMLELRYRALCSSRKERQNFLHMKKNCIVIQSYLRMFICRKRYLNTHKAIVIIQSYFRMHIAHKKFLKIRESVKVLQKYLIAWREGRKENQKYLELKKSAIWIQRSYRKWKLYKVTLQLNNLNGYTSQHMWYSKLKDSIKIFQHHVRLYITKRKRAAIVIQSYYRMWLAQKKFKKEKSALKIQTMWRGFSVRRNITDRKILSARKKIVVSDDYHSLRSRTKRSIQILLKHRNINFILSAVQDLEVCTRMLPTCCERLEESGGLHVIVTLIRSCNRSEPHKEIIIFCINILLNVAKYQKTMNSIWEQENLLETIVDLMKTYKDKTIPIFSKCCNLLWIFCQDPEKAQLLKNCKKFTDQIKILHNSVIRKFTVAQKSAQVPKTTCHNFSFDPRASLQIDPDWLLGKHRMREFKDSVIAISSLMLLLELSTDNSISHTVKK